MSMPLHPSWSDIVLRLALTMLAGAIIGLDRGAAVMPPAFGPPSWSASPRRWR